MSQRLGTAVVQSAYAMLCSAARLATFSAELSPKKLRHDVCILQAYLPTHLPLFQRD
jgi:hypothetical protein